MRATMRVRNDEMIAARERLGLSQKRLAGMASVRVDEVGSFESLKYDQISTPIIQKAHLLAECLEIAPEAVLPAGVEGKNLNMDQRVIRTISCERLLTQEYIQRTNERMLPPPPGESMEKEEYIASMLDQVFGKDNVTPRPWEVREKRHRTVLELRFGLNGNRPHFLSEIAKRLGITRERVRQVEVKALRKVQEAMENDGLKDLDKNDKVRDRLTHISESTSPDNTALRSH